MEKSWDERWKALREDCERRKPGAWFLLTDRLLQGLLCECTELFPLWIRALMNRPFRKPVDVKQLEAVQLMPKMFAPYSVRTPDYRLDVIWDRIPQSIWEMPEREVCRYHLMLEETPVGDLVLRIFEWKMMEEKREISGSAMVYIRNSSEIPKGVRYRFRGREREAYYTIPAVCLSGKTPEELCREGMAFYLPLRYMERREDEWAQEAQWHEIEEAVESAEIGDVLKEHLLGLCAQAIQGVRTEGEQ